jgi:hypothetical protein
VNLLKLHNSHRAERIQCAALLTAIWKDEMNPTAYEIQHDPARSCFYTVVDGLQAVADYRLEGTRMLFTHTGVPQALEGRGIAAALVKQAFEWAEAQHLQIVPLCSYVRAYLQRHPEYQGLAEERKT